MQLHQSEWINVTTTVFTPKLTTTKTSTHGATIIKREVEGNFVVETTCPLNWRQFRDSFSPSVPHEQEKFENYLPQLSSVLRNRFFGKVPGASSVQWTHRRRYFAVQNESLQRSDGFEELVRLELVTDDNKKIALGGFSPSSLLQSQELQNSLDLLFENSRLGDTLWPVPHGEIAVFWSTSAMATLASHFLEALEARAYLGQKCFLEDLDGTTIRFSVADTAPWKADSEGTTCQPLSLFEQNTPKAIIATCHEADRLGTIPNGHFRSHSYRSHGGSCFWNVSFIPEKTVSHLINQVPGGIWIEEISVRQWCLQSGEIELEVALARLVHQGQKGERLEKFKWNGNLATLLGTMTLSDSDTSTHWITHHHGQRTEFPLRLNAAMSPGLDLRGSVPTQYYWPSS